MPRDLRAQADELETWWNKDTKEAARHNINGKKLEEKEGGASTVDELFNQTCKEMEAEAAEAYQPQSGETADPESPIHILACRSPAISDSGLMLGVVVTYKLSPRYPVGSNVHTLLSRSLHFKSSSKSSNKNMGSTTRAALKRTRSTASLNDAAKILLRFPSPLQACNNTFLFRQYVLDLHHAKPDHGTNTQFPTRTALQNFSTNLKAGKPGKSKSARNVSSETKVCPQSPAPDRYKSYTPETSFKELPRELRDQIWSLAIRDDHPGAHIFGQYVTGSRRVRSQDGCDENISTYLIDGGLWAACHESRCIMEKHFNQSKRQLAPRSLHDRRNSFSQQDLFKKASSGYFDGTPMERVTVFPLRDLFILQHEDLEEIDWNNIDYELALASLTEGFYGVNHIAIEYDRAWADESRQKDILYTFSQACVGVTYTLWFIDRSLKRKSQAPVFEEESETAWKINAFYASDRKFLEIEDDGTLMDNWEYVGPVETNWYDHIYDSLEFVRELDAKLDEDKVTAGTEAEDHCVVKLLGWAPL
ncbi:hypothetical protein FNAPI_13598 [Fusarium napiforme]|uniref:2EXR domain-containing protein n=1 Tax=Fusarium napiforme TaxID=42672 RepID=A0A8H5MJM1_9HYPO|nr:hypothetical protein FNAPI_13598 [Fusarium napiforme]